MKSSNNRIQSLSLTHPVYLIEGFKGKLFQHGRGRSAIAFGRNPVFASSDCAIGR